MELFRFNDIICGKLKVEPNSGKLPINVNYFFGRSTSIFDGSRPRLTVALPPADFHL